MWFAGERGYANRMLAVLALGTTASMTGRLVISPLLPRIIDGLSITPVRAGVALSVMWACVALSQYPGGRLSDDLSRKTVLVLALCLLIVGAALLAGAPGYAAFLLGAAAYGLGGGLYPPAAFAQLSDLFTERRGRAFGINSASVNLGGVIAAGLGTAALAAATWRVAFVPVLAALGLILALMHRWNADPYAVRGASIDVRGTARRLVAIPGVRWMLVASGLSAFTWQGTASFLPTLLQVEKGLSPALAGNAFAGLFLVGMVANPIAGTVGDRVGYPHVAAVASLLGAAGLGVVVIAGGPVAVIAGVAVFGVGLAAFWPAMNAYVMSTLPAASRGGDFGAIRTAFVLVGSLGPATVGVVAERLSYSAAFAGLAACLVGSLLVTAWLVRADPGISETPR